MNPDIFRPVEVPSDLSRYFRRAMVAFSNEPVDLEFVVRGTGYCYLGWTPGGRWEGVVDGELQFDTDRDGPFHLSGQVFDGHVVCRSSGLLRQIFCEFSAIGQYELLGILGVETFERALNPVSVEPDLTPVRKALDSRTPLSGPDDLAHAMFSAVSKIAAAHQTPAYLADMVGVIEQSHGDVRIASVLAEAPFSERKAREEFGNIVGLSPKRFAKLLQINYAFGALLDLGERRLADLALECGFADQAHLTRSFAEFLGSSPIRFSRDIEPTLKQFVGLSRQTNQSAKSIPE